MTPEQKEVVQRLREQTAGLTNGVAAPETVHTTVRVIDVQALIAVIDSLAPPAPPTE